MTLLAERVQVERRFQRSIRIDTDLTDPRALEGFVCPKSSADVLLVMARHIREAGQAAFTWTGPYGSGKSSLVVALSAVLNTATSNKAAAILGKGLVSDLLKAFPLKNKGWRILPVVGKRAPVAATIGEALISQRLVRKAVTWSDDNIISALESLAGEKSGDYGGLVVFLDEMGKFFEAATQDGTDIFIFQRLAEAAARSNGRLVIVGILHQAFDEYAQRVGRELRDEWAKVQGRYVDLAVTLVGDEQLELLAQAITTSGGRKNKAHAEAAKVVGAIVRRGRRGSDPAIGATLERCWPLHPIVACLLGPISRRRFGQNQRSLFGFLNSAEPYGFQEFARNESDSAVYGPDILWDYLRTNLEPAILASPDAHRWSTAVEAVERAEAQSGSIANLGVLKTIALLDLFRERSGLSATEELLTTMLPADAGRSDVKDVLKELRDASFVTFRKHLGAYAIHSGSDFDIEQAISENVSSIRELNFAELRTFAGLQPIIAKRHYHKTGALRWFDVDIVPLSDLANEAPRATSGDAIGKFLLVVPAQNGGNTKAAEICREFTRTSNKSLAIGLSAKAWQIVPFAREFLAVSKISEENVALGGDAVARREVGARLADARTRLETGLQELFDAADWYRAGAEPTSLTYSQLNVFASDIADEIFSDSPYILSELLNRDKPSSNAVSAEKNLLRAMVLNQSAERLGIDGFPAERGLYETVVRATGLHVCDKEGAWRFAAPSSHSPCNLSPAWQGAKSFLKSVAEGRVGMGDLFSIWRSEPFGIKDGLMRVLSTAFILAERDHLAIYREGVFQPGFSDLDVDYLVADPNSIQIRWVEVSGKSKALLEDLAKVALVPTERESGSYSPEREPIEVARALVGAYYDLQPWAKRTNDLSQNAVRVRSLFKNASDPNKFLFDDLTSLLEEGSSNPEKSPAGLVEEGLAELRAVYPERIKRLKKLLLSELRVKDGSKHALSELRDRAENIRNMGDNELRAFAIRLSQFTGSESDVEGIVGLLTGKPPRDWIDADLEAAEFRIPDYCRKFLHAETLAHVRGRKDKRNAMAVMISRDGLQEPHIGEFTVAESEKDAIEVIVRRMESALRASGAHEHHVVLAALAELSVRYLDEYQASSATLATPKSVAAE